MQNAAALSRGQMLLPVVGSAHALQQCGGAQNQNINNHSMTYKGLAFGRLAQILSKRKVLLRSEQS